MAKKRRKKKRIRCLALCIFRRDDKIFVARGYDSKRDQVFYRPIGGAIEFGERGGDAVAREVMEEIGAAVADLRYLGALENIFTYEGKPGHEITLIYDARFVDAALNRDDIEAQGSDDGEVLFDAMWMELDEFRGGSATLYPDGLLALIDTSRIAEAITARV